MAERAIKTHNCYTGKRGMDVQDSDSRLFQPSSGRFTNNILCFVSLFLSRVKRKKKEEEKQPRLQVLGFFTQRTTATPKLSSKLKIIIKKIGKKWSCLICREEGFEGNYR